MAPPEPMLICWPFHNGLPGVGMGAGAEVLAGDAGLRAGIEAAGWCLGAVWFDAHADFDDPDDNADGFFDVMGLAMLTGRGWRALRATTPGHVPIAERAVVLAGVRDLEPHQRRRLDASAVRAVPGAIDPEAFADALAGLGGEVSRVHLDVDLDSLDRAEATANADAAPGGPTLERLLACIDLVCGRFTVAAGAVAAYDPSLDADGRTLRAARAVVAAIARGVRPEGSGGGAGGTA